MNLNEKQSQAVQVVEWPLLIIAGAGSGKTATLTSRVEYMVREKNISPRNILCVTFTNKAAREMKERVAKNLWIDIENNAYRSRSEMPFIWTFHSFWVSVLKEFIEKIGYKKEFLIYDTSDQISLLKQILKEMNIDEKEYSSRKIGGYISNAKNALISPENYGSLVDSNFKEVVHDVYKKYQKKLLENNALDFDDILVKTLLILQKPEILEIFHERYRYIMIDEYQDTNIPQYEIVKLLASKYRNLAVVGDDWQSIYSWRGADMRNILNFQKDYPEAVVVKLEQNYRSTKKIISAANQVIKNNKKALEKTLWTDNDDGEFITLFKTYDDKSEAQKIVQVIKEHGRPYSRNLILYRTNWQSRQIEESLIKEWVPYKVIWGLKFYERMEIKDMMAYLKILYNPSDTISMKRIINVPTRKIGARSIEVLDEYKAKYDLQYLQIMENIEDVEDLNNGAKTSLRNFLNMYTHLAEELWKCSTLWAFTELLIETIGYKKYLESEYTQVEYDSKIENLDELINVLSTYDGIETKAALGQFIDEVSLLSDLDSMEEGSDYVTLMTIHTAKWLEREHVFVAGVEEGILPHVRSLTNLQELEEERRLMYVAMTRAKQRLYLTIAKERFSFWEYVRNIPSRFIEEISKEFLQEEEVNRTGMSFSFSTNISTDFTSISWKYETTSMPFTKVKHENNISDFWLWDRVEHPKFGNGIITEMNGEIASIAFVGQWVKKMNIKIAPVRKITA